MCDRWSPTCWATARPTLTSADGTATNREFSPRLRQEGPCGVQATSVLGDGRVAFALSRAEGNLPVYLERLALDGTRDPGFAGSRSTALAPPSNGFLVHFELAGGGQTTAAEIVRPRCRPISGDAGIELRCHSVILVARHADGRPRRSFDRDGMAVLRFPG